MALDMQHFFATFMFACCGASWYRTCFFCFVCVGLRVFNDASRYVDQGGGKRKGSLAVYLEPWHSDIFEFLDLRKNHGKEEMRARDLFPALWIPDIFMQRVYENGKQANCLT